MQEQQESAASQSGRSQLPTLAPRYSQPQSSSSRDRTTGSASASGRPPRLSHRSRAGCWTCRARKVKCDETHPRCGPCTRLSRTCDWDHRWNFSDATVNTQTKYSNVTTSGNAVWDPDARNNQDASPIIRQPDDMPAFAILTNDDERERKAETQRPGTFGVVVTPESFADLPEYAGPTSPNSRRGSVQSQASSLMGYSGSLVGKALSRSQTDPNVVVLERFEDASPTMTGPWPNPLDSRRPSLPDRIQYLSIATSRGPGSMMPPSPILHMATTDDRLISHFRKQLLPRLVQPQAADLPGDILTSMTKDLFELEARTFPPLHHAISALSALNLSYNGAASVDTAHSHYGQALPALSAAASTEELLSNGTFLSHFLLFVYDISIPMQHDDGAANIWAIHLSHLQRIAKLRHENLGPEQHGYLIWAICELDVYACLLGSGDCSFVRTVVQNDMMPALEQQLPSSPTSMLGVYAANEVSIFPAILALRQAILIQIANLAQAAQRFRQQAKSPAAVSPGTYASWQATVSQLQTQLAAVWTQAYPRFLPPESPQAGRELPPRPRFVFEQAFFLYQTAVIYSRTSMFHRQRTIPMASQQEIFADTESRIMAIVALASSQLESRNVQLAEHRHVIFPLFIAGFATSQPDVKIQALNVIKAHEGMGIGQNTYTTRRLLSAVYEEQRRAVDEGRRMEDVDWVKVAKHRSLAIVNCGL